MQLQDKSVQCRLRALRDDFDTSAVWQIPNVAVKAKPATGADGKETEADTLHAAADGCA